MTAADYIVEQLRAWGVRTVFGVTGSAVFPLLEALSRREGLRYVTARHVEGAALMASAHAKLTGEVSVCLAHAGPGAAQLVGGLYDAQRDGAPVLALTGEMAEDRWGSAGRPSPAQSQMLAECTGWSRRAESAADLPELLRAALRFTTVREEVAHLALPVDVQAAPLPAGLAPAAEPDGYLRRAPTPDEAAVAVAAEILGRALRPGLLVGRGAVGLGAQVLALAERLQAPVAVSLFAKGLIPDDHPLAAGVLGEAGCAYSQGAFADRDAVAVLGSTWWPAAGAVPAEAAVVQVDVRAERIGARYPLALGIAADLASVLPALTRRLPERPLPAVRGTGKSGWLAALRWEGWEEMPAHPARVMAELRLALPEDAIVAVDTGLMTLWYGGYFPSRRETTLVSGRFRTMGFGLPAALAAKVARPERAVVALCGDGGFGMSLPEILTAAQHGIGVTAVVCNNGSLGEEAARQALQGRDVWGTDLGRTDFAALARAAGLQGVRVDRPEEIAGTVRRALESGLPTVVDIPTALVPPPSLQRTAGAPIEATIRDRERAEAEAEEAEAREEERRRPVARI